MALSTKKEEYVETIVASREVVWLFKIFVVLFDQVLETTVIYCDNQSSVKLSERAV